ncbi:hypothetical protein GCM10027167_28180 [Nocardia heshunensis]
MTTDRTAAAPVAVRNPAPVATRRLDRQARRPERIGPHPGRVVRSVVPSAVPVVPAACRRADRTGSRRAVRCRRAVSPLDVRARRRSDRTIRMRHASCPIPPIRTPS